MNNENSLPVYLSEISGRIKELRTILDISAMDMAKDINVPYETYNNYENGEEDIPISVLYNIAGRLGVDVTVLMTGEDPRMASAAVCRKGKGVQVERYPGYEYSSLAYNFKGRTIEPLLVTIDSSKAPSALVAHSGQEFNYVVEGRMKVTVASSEYLLDEGDSIYFDASLPHNQSALSEGDINKARFITIIQDIKK